MLGGKAPKTHHEILLTMRSIFLCERSANIRQREHFIGLWLDDKEYAALTEHCKNSGLSTSAVIRKLIVGVQIRPRPPDTYAALLRELSAIGNNINQLAYWANAYKGSTRAEIHEAAKLARSAWRLVKDSV